MWYTCKKLTEMFKEANPGTSVEVRKCKVGGRLTGYSEVYQLRAELGKYTFEAYTLKELVRDIKCEARNSILTLKSNYYLHQGTIAINVPSALWEA